MARIWRQGQTKPCFIYRFVLAGTLEELLVAASEGVFLGGDMLGYAGVFEIQLDC